MAMTDEQYAKVVEELKASKTHMHDPGAAPSPEHVDVLGWVHLLIECGQNNNIRCYIRDVKAGRDPNEYKSFFDGPYAWERARTLWDRVMALSNRQFNRDLLSAARDAYRRLRGLEQAGTLTPDDYTRALAEIDVRVQYAEQKAA